MAREAGRLMVQRIEERPEEFAHVEFATTFVERRTLSAPSAH
jgi:LacI family transcriptional regulator